MNRFILCLKKSFHKTFFLNHHPLVEIAFGTAQVI